MVIGLLLMAGVISVTTNMQRASNIQMELARVQEDGRFIIEEMSRAIRLTGHDDPDTVLTPTAPFIQALNDPDVLSLRFEGSNGIADCLGRPTTAGTEVLNVYSVTLGNLVCSVTTDAGAATVEVVANDIESLQLRFGLDTDADGTPNRYVSADDVGNWNNVVVVQFGILGRTANEVNHEQDTSTYMVIDQISDPTDDRRLRRVYTHMVALRNNI